MDTQSTILIADDDLVARKFLERALGSLGFRLILTEHGQAAFEAALSALPDLILLDVMMPVMNGFEVCRRLRNEPRVREVPIILVTTLDDKVSRLRGIEAGADEFLTKPYDVAELKARVGAISRLNRYRMLLNERAKFEQLVDIAPEGIVVTRTDTGICVVNRAFRQMTGFGSDERLIGSDFLSLISVAEREKVKSDLLDRTGHDSMVVSMEAQLCGKSDSALPVEITSRCLEWENAPAILILVRDISARRNAEATIREQAALLNITRDAMLTQDLNGQITFWNEGARTLYGITSEAAIGRNLFELMPLTEASRSNQILECVQKEGQWAGELEQHTKTGRKMICDSHWTRFCDEAGKPLGTLIVNRDITEKKVLESQFLRTERLQSLGTLAGGIAHDLNNVLAPILASLSMFKDELPGETNQRLLSLVDSSARRGADIIKQILAFTRGTEGEKTLLQVKHLLLELERMLRTTLPPSIQIRKRIGSELRPILGDATQLYQVLMNLCVNGRDAMPDGGLLTLEIENVQVDDSQIPPNSGAKSGSFVRVSVSDTGSGIPPEIIDQIFEPFFTTKELGKGTGLGLATVQSVVRNHAGFVTVKSQLGQGARFDVYLPAVEKSFAGGDTATNSALPAGRGEMVLVVDDEPAVCEITKATLERNGYRVLTASDGAEAVAIFAQRHSEIRLVLSDLLMPYMDGTNTMRAMHRIDPAISLLGMSGQLEKKRIEDVVDPVGIDILSKPFSADLLLHKLHEILHPENNRCQVAAPPARVSGN